VTIEQDAQGANNQSKGERLAPTCGGVQMGGLGDRHIGLGACAGRRAQRLDLSQRLTRKLSEDRLHVRRIEHPLTRPDPNHRPVSERLGAPVECGAHEARGD